MDKFVIKDIDDFDLEFSREIGTSAPAAENYAAPISAENIGSPAPASNTYQPAPAGEPAPAQTGFQVDIPDENQDAAEKKPFSLFDGIDDEEDDEPKAKGSKGALAGKIVSIVMLALTVVVFILGCLVSVFLDNNGASLAGMTFNSVTEDIDMGNDNIIGKGSLVIGHAFTYQEASDMINNGEDVYLAIGSATGEGCNIAGLIGVIPGYQEDEFQLTVYDVTTGYQSTINSSDCYGEASNYFPAVASIINFAMNNAILVCILFVLLAALWCLVLILIEKSGAKKTEEELPTEDNAPEIDEDNQ